MSHARLLLGGLAAVVVGGGAAAQRIDLAAALHPLGLAGDVTAFTLTGEDTRVLFLLQDATGPVLCSATLAARPVGARLSPTGLAEIDPALALPAAGDLVAFRARAAGETLHRLFVVPCDGSLSARTLELPALTGDLTSFTLDPSGTWALYLFGRLRREHLYSLLLDASSPPIELNQPIGSDREVTDFELVSSSSGARVLYRVDALRNAWYELFSVPIDRSQAPVRLNGELALHGDVYAFLASPDGARAAYVAEENVNDQAELFVRPSDGSGQPLVLHAAPTPEGDVRLARFSPDGRTLAFLADLEADERVELYAAPADGSALASKLSGALVAGGNVLDFVFAANQRVLYRADQDVDERIELYGVDLGAPGRAERLSAAPSSDDVIRIEALERARLVLYAAEASPSDRHELCCAPLRGPAGAFRGASAASVRNLAPELALARDDGAPAWAATSDGAWVFLRARRAPSLPLELFQAPTFGPTKPAWLDGSPAGGVVADVREVRLTADGTGLVYRGALDPSGRIGLYLRRL